MNTPPLAHKVIIPRPWVKSEATDIRITFARVIAEQEKAVKTNVRAIKAKR